MRMADDGLIDRLRAAFAPQDTQSYAYDPTGYSAPSATPSFLNKYMPAGMFTGDPEAQASAGASQAMPPVVPPYLAKALMQYAQFGKSPPPENRVLSPDGLSGHTAFDIAPQPPMQSGDPVINLPSIGTYDAPWFDPNDFAAKYRRFNPDVNARVYSDFLTGQPQYPGPLNSMMIGKLK